MSLVANSISASHISGLMRSKALYSISIHTVRMIDSIPCGILSHVFQTRKPYYFYISVLVISWHVKLENMCLFFEKDLQMQSLCVAE